jgi:hypothetical protein
VAYRILPFRATIPAGTLPTSPFTQALDLDNWSIEALDLEVLPGPGGVLGFQVYNNGVAWLPYGADEWLIWDDVRERYSLTDQPTASGWAIVGYNTGTYDHDVIARFHVNQVIPTPTPTVTPTLQIVSGAQPSLATVTL